MTPVAPPHDDGSRAVGGAWGRLAICLLLSVAASGLVYGLCLGRGEFGDEGSYCLIGQGILRGGLPYRDFFNEKPPLQYFLTAATMAVSHATLAGARVLPAVSLGLSMLMVLLASPARRLAGLAAAVGWAVVLAAASMVLLAFTDTAESSLAVLYGLAALLVLRPGVLERRPVVVALVVGGVFGLACGFRQTAIAAAVVVLFMPRMRPYWRFVAVGFAAGFLAWTGAMMALGIGRELVESTLLFHLSNPGAAKYFRTLSASDRPALLLCVAAFGLVVEGVWRRGQSVWILVWILAMTAPFYGRMDPFRLWPAMVVTVLVLALHAPQRRRLAVLAPLGLTVLAGLSLLASHPQHIGLEDEARMITARSGPNDALWIAPASPLLYCLADRRPASKYYFVLPWTGKADVLARVERDLTRNKPRLIGDVSDEEYQLKTVAPQAQAIIDKDYHLVAQDTAIRLYERNGAAPR